MSLERARVTSARVVPAGPFVAPVTPGVEPPATTPEPIPAHCRVTFVLEPTTDSNINVELWMPTESWNGKFLAVGNGGWAGRIQRYDDMQEALRRGYATAGTDTGSLGRRRSRRHVRPRTPREGRGFRVSRDPRHDREVEAADRGVLRAAARLLVFQGVLHGRSTGRDGRAAIPGRFRRHHRGRSRQPTHLYAYGGRRSPHRDRTPSRARHFRREGAIGDGLDDESVRHARRRVPEQSAPVSIRLFDSAVHRERLDARVV